MGAIGHPGDIERLRMAAIELASAEGFTRSAGDVSLRRLAHYSLSPVLKTAFEQVYGAPYLARMLFAEIGAKQETDLFLRLEYDGAIATNSATFAQSRQDFGAISGTRQSTELMETFLRAEHSAGATFERALKVGLDAWTVGHLALSDGAVKKELPTREKILAERKERLRAVGVEAAVLERDDKTAIRYRGLTDAEIRSALGD
jgi:proteasome alpha subunit